MPFGRPLRILLWSLLTLVLLLAVAAISLLTVPPPLERWLQGKVIDALRQHYQRDVQLQNLKVTLVPEFEATADNFVLPNRDPHLAPFVTAKHFTVKAGVLQLLRKPVRLTYLKLEGMEIHVPPKGSNPPPSAGASPAAAPKQTRLANFVIDKVDADGTRLFVLRKNPLAEPMDFDIRKLTLRSAGIGQPMKFTAELTNALPPGLVHSTGSFGPWNFDEPSSTGLSGHYVFEHADLSVFNGISGILSSTGDYTGVLNNIIVDGRTDTPDFRLDRGAAEVHLTTMFHAIVDGTNGNTYLEPVNAHFAHSNVMAKGQVAGEKGKGKTISLEVDVKDSRVQDLLQLASKQHSPALLGQLDFQGHVTVPPGSERVLKKLFINGNFRVEKAKFTSEKVKKVIVEASRRGQGRPKDESIQDVLAQFAGFFRLKNTELEFNPLLFSVPGVAARLKGSYGLLSEKINFIGDVRLDATISAAVGGKERWILAPFDPIFMRHAAGTYLPLKIEGTREHPEIKIQWKKLF